MNILITGNGFDLYHGLPTRYTDFLFFYNNWDLFRNLHVIDTHLSNDSIVVPLGGKYNNVLNIDSINIFAQYNGYNKNELSYIDNHINNKWITHFNKSKNLKENWIDFEDEIFRALNKVKIFYDDILYRRIRNSSFIPIKDSSNLSTFEIIDLFGCNSNGYNERIINGTLSKHYLNKEYFNEQKNIVLNSMKKELDELNQCLRIYLKEFVSRLKPQVYSNQVMNLGQCNIVNYNYTNTYNKIYKRCESNTNYFIHGLLDDDNMVIGIDDHEFKDDNTYNRFKKGFQCVLKDTNKLPKEWFESFNDLNDESICLYIFGHSLGRADWNSLSDLFVSKRIKKLVVFFNDNSKEQLIENMINMLDYDLFLAFSQEGKIEFIPLEEPSVIIT